MPIKKDETGKRWVEMEVLLSGTPEQVWQAIATGPGNTAWFVKSEIEPRVGGAVRLDFGHGATSEGEITTWEPPHKFAYLERDWSPDAPPVATEITVIGRPGNRCVLRMVHSLFTSSDAWDDEMEGFESGWPGFFAVLRTYLAHFAGQPAHSFMTMMPANTDALSAWQRLNERLDLTGASVGEQRTTVSGPERWSGVVEHVYQDAQQRYVLLRIQEPSPGIVLVGTYDKGATSHTAASANTSSISVCRYFYGDGSSNLANESEARWRDWIALTFGAEQQPTTDT